MLVSRQGFGDAARLITIEREIDRNFGDPEFSLTLLAQRLGVTPRYVQMLLAANETSFIDELMEPACSRRAICWRRRCTRI